MLVNLGHEGWDKMQKEHDEQRAKYMAHGISHDDFYCWLADKIGVRVEHLPFTFDQINKALLNGDKPLNSLPLRKWDYRDFLIRQLAYDAGMKSWSLSDTVCTLKAFARREAVKLREETVDEKQ